MKSLTKRYGGWAIVTGASSGIGRRFAHRVATDGMNLVLVARSEDALQQTADEIHDQYAVQTRVLTLDLSQPISREILDRETVDLDVGLLINNAAVEQRGTFVRHSIEEIRQGLELNVTAPTELAQIFGRRFVKRGHGGIVFISGSIAYQAVPYLANYAAAKSHQLNLAEAMYYELKPYGVDILALAPGLTKTPMVRRLEESINFGRIGMLKLDPDLSAAAGLKYLGRKPSHTVGLQYQVFALLTKRVLSRAAGAWLFGTLIRSAFNDCSKLDPNNIPQDLPPRETTFKQIDVSSPEISFVCPDA